MTPHKSKVWQFFAFLSNKKKVKCNRCSTVLAYCGNTTNMKNHLLALHSSECAKVNEDAANNSGTSKGQEEQIMDVDEPRPTSTSLDANATNSTEPTPSSSSGGGSKNPLKRVQKTIRDLFPKKKSKSSNQETETTASNEANRGNEAESLSKEGSDDVTIPELFEDQKSYEESRPKWKKVTNLLLFWVAKDNLPLDVVDGEGFKVFMKEVLPKYKPPGRKKLTKLLDEKYEVLSKKIKNRLSKDVKHVSLTTNIWTHEITSRSYLGLTVHFYNADLHKIESHILAVEPLSESHTAEHIEDIIKLLLHEWDIPNDKVKFATTDGGGNIVKAVEDLLGKDRRFTCFAHKLNNIVSDALEKTEGITDLINRVKEIVTYFKHSIKASDKLRAAQRAKGVPEGKLLKLIQSCVTRWNSTYDMLERCFTLSDIVNRILLECEGNPPQVINADELVRLKEICAILKPFKQATTLLSGQEYATVGMVIPIVFNLRKKCESPKFTIVFNRGNSLRLKLLKNLNEKFMNIESSPIYSISTFLDPRYKKLHFQSSVAVANLLSRLSSKMKSLRQAQEEQMRSGADESNSDNEQEKNHDDDFWSEHKKLKAASSCSASSETLGGLPLELRLYCEEPLSDDTANPFAEWEKKLKFKYPLLYQIMLEYSFVPATSVPSEQLFSKAGALACKKRNRLKPKRLHMLLFLKSLSFYDWNI